MKIHEIIYKTTLTEALGNLAKTATAAAAKKAAAVAAEKAAKPTAAAAVLFSMLKAIGISAVPISDYYNEMEKAEKALEANEITKSQYDSYRMEQLTILIEQLAIGLSGYFVKNITYGKLLPVFKNWMPNLARSMQTINTIGEVAFVSWLASDRGRKFIATYLTNEYIVQLVGGGSARLLDYFESLIPGFNTEHALSPYNKPTKTTQQNTLSYVPAAAAALGTKTPTDQSTGSDEYIDQNMKRDPKDYWNVKPTLQ